MMCRMAAFSSERTVDIKPYFDHLQRMAKEGKKSPHPHGWGMFCVGGGKVIYHRSEKAAFEDEPPIFRANLCIMHARKASPGTKVWPYAVHPFLFMKDGKIFALAHNGSLDLAEEEKERLIFGVDTEILLERMAEGWFEGLVKLAGRASSLTTLVSDGEKLWAFRCCTKSCDYYTLFLREEEGIVVISSEGEGRELRNGELLGIENGRIVSSRVLACGGGV